MSLFVDEMRAMREQRGWTRGDLARATNYSESLIAMVETYQRAPTLALAKTLDRALETPGFTEGTGDDPGTPGTFMRLWRKLRALSVPVSFRSFVEHEEKAAELRMFEHSLVPGLFQTEDYARATLVRQPNTTEDRVAELLAVRMARQAVLSRKSPPPPLIWALIDELLGGRVVEEAEAVAEASLHFSSLRSDALPQMVSRDLMAKAAEEQWTA